MPNSSPPLAVTLRDIARELGISHVTVSLALRDHPKIPEPKRRHIQFIARQMGYFPSVTATALSHYKRDAKDAPAPAVLAWLKPQKSLPENRSFNNPCRYWEGAFHEAERLGYQLKEVVMPCDLTPRQADDFLAMTNVNGVLLPHQLTADQSFASPHFPAVRLGHLANATDVCTVADNTLSNVITAFKQVWAKGYRRIGLVLELQTAGPPLSRVGFLHARSNQEQACKIPPLVLPQQTQNRSRKFLAWLQQHEPDAVLLECLTLPDADLLVGRHVYFALLDVPHMSATNFPGIYRHASEVGRLAVSELTAQINDHANISPVLRHLYVEGTWTDGSESSRSS